MTRTLIRSILQEVWGNFTFQHGMAASACSLAIWMQYQYRLQGSGLFIVLPAVGAVLLVLNILLIVNQYVRTLPKWDPVRFLLERVEWSAGLLVRVFVYLSLLLYANGILDHTHPVYRPAEIVSEGWRSVSGIPVPYSWVTLRYQNDPDHAVRVLITWQEQGRLWGAQPVSVVIKNGLLGIPTVTAIRQDWGWYGSEILKLAPTASLVMQMKLSFDFGQDRWNEGVEAVKRYLELNPKDWETAILAGELLFQGSKYYESLAFYEHGIKQHPSYSNMQEYGTALNWAGQSEHAAEVLKTSIPLDPDNWEAYYHLGYVYGDMGQFEEAIHYFEEALKRRPHSLEAKVMIANYQQDIAWMEKLKRGKPKNVSSSAER